MTPLVDDDLRARALVLLSAHGDALARELLAVGRVVVEHGVRNWEGSHGAVRGHRVVVQASNELVTRAEARPATFDELARALSAAIAERGREALVELAVEVGPASSDPRLGPYRS